MIICKTPLRAHKPKIDTKMCDKDYSCVAFCPRNAISINAAGFPVIDDKLCDGCLICLRECPCAAITEERE